MKKTLSIFFITILITTLSFGQENNNISKFEQKLKLFRFSLHKELDKLDDDTILKFSFNKKDSIAIVINDFIQKNNSEILEYKKHLLSSHVSTPFVSINFENYSKVPMNTLQLISKINVVDMPLMNLLHISPFEETQFYKTMYFTGEKSSLSLARYNAKKSITSYLIQTKKINSTQWEIIDNSYDIICKFIYDVKKGKVISFEVFERK